MSMLRLRWMDNLDTIAPADLQEITADGHVFASPHWFQLAQSLDLSEIVGGSVQLRFLVAFADLTPVAICPVLRISGAGVYFVYNMRQYFFEHWIEEAVRLNPQRKEYFARLFAGVSSYRRFLEWTGSRLDDCLLVTDPISYRCHVAVSPSSPFPREEVYAEIIRGLQRYSHHTKLPLWFLGVEGEKGRWHRALAQSRCKKSFLFYDNQIDLSSFGNFEAYLHSFRRTTRRAFQRDIRRTEEAGITFRFEQDLEPLADQLSELYEETYGKYGSSHFHHPPAFWRTATRSLGRHGEVILAEQAGQLLGFSLLLHSPRRGEMWTYRIGRKPPTGENVPYYFSLSFYGPIQRAIELGYRRIWLGPASYEAKQVRGAQPVPLYSYFWHPRKWDRWFLEPFLQLFGQVSREQIDAVLEPKEEAAEAPSPAKSPASSPTSRDRKKRPN